MTIEPDTKDWTWVLDRPCPECAFDAAALDRHRLPGAIEDNATLWGVVLDSDDAAVRPEPHLWSPLEYACHVRDVNRVFEQRVLLMLSEDDPEFADWDQDAAAVEDDYGSQEPRLVADEVAASAASVAATYAAVPADGWRRTGRRSNGSLFTVDSVARYHLHDLVHHAHDVSHVTRRATVAAYDAFAEAYRDGLAAARAGADDDRGAALAGFAAQVAAGGRVLEIGSGPGHDAEELEAAGLSVRRTDVSRGFVRLLRGAGHDADVVDPLVDDLADPARPGVGYDAVWASASLLHVRREDLPTVLERLARACRGGAVLGLSVKEGDGARFSTHGHVAAPRHFTFWREGALRSVLEGSGWSVQEVGREAGLRDEQWLVVLARRA